MTIIGHINKHLERMSSGESRENGFSLVELLIVCALIAILVGIGTPAILANRPNWFIKGTARDIASKLMAARIKAIQDNKYYVVEFQNDTSEPFSIYWVEPTGSDGDPLPSSSVDPPNVRITSENAYIYGETYSNVKGPAVGIGFPEGGVKMTGCSNIIFAPAGKSYAIQGGAECATVLHDGVGKYHRKVEMLGSHFPAQYIYVSPLTGNIQVSTTPPGSPT